MTLKEAKVGGRVRYIGPEHKDGPRYGARGTIVSKKRSYGYDSYYSCTVVTVSFDDHFRGALKRIKNGRRFVSRFSSPSDSRSIESLVASNYIWRKL